MNLKISFPMSNSYGSICVAYTQALGVIGRVFL